MNTYTLSITGDPLGDSTTGVIKQVPWKLTGTDGTHTAYESGTAHLPAIDPKSPTFIPLAQITVPVLLQWAGMLLDLPNLQSLIDATIAEQSAPALSPLQLAPDVTATAMAGVAVLADPIAEPPVTASLA